MRWLLVVAALAVLASPCAALAAELGLSEQALWEGESLSIGCAFQQIPSGGVYVSIQEPIIVSIPMEQANQTHYALEYQPPVIGQYSLSCGNGSLESSPGSFTVSRLEANLTSLPDMAYIDQGIGLRASVKRDSGQAQDITSGVDFSVTLGGVSLDIEGTPYFYEGSWVITTEPPSGIGQGSHLLMAKASHQGADASSEALIDVSEPLHFSIDSVSPDEVRGGENVTVGLSATYHGTDVLASSSIRAILDGQSLNIKRTPSGFSFQCPGLEPEPHELNVSLEHQGSQASGQRHLYYMIHAKSEIRNADNKGVSATLKFHGQDRLLTARTNVNGAFSMDVPAGDYDIEMRFSPDIRATARGVELDGDAEDFVRFDTYSPKEVQGIRVARIFALEFTLPFGGMDITASYDASGIGDESGLEVLTCRQWNMDSRTCSGDWDDVDFSIDDVKNTVEFSVEHLSAFLVGEKADLDLDFTIDREEYMPGQDIRLRGLVEDGSGNPVSGALVSYSIEGGRDGEARTNSNGVFSATFPAPGNGGDYEIVARVSRGLSGKDTESQVFSVMTIREVRIIPPVRAEVSEGSEARVESVLVNTGQEVLTDCIIEVSGLPGSWYSTEPKSVSALIPDEEKKVFLKIRPEGAEEEVYTITLSAECEGARASEGFVLYVNLQEEERESSQVDSSSGENKSKGRGDSVSAYFTWGYEGFVNNISLILSGGILLVIFRRLRSGRRQGRQWLVAMMGSLRNEALKKPEPKRPNASGRGRSRKTRK